MNFRAFVSTDRLRAGHCILEASLSRFNIAAAAECECGDRLRTEEHVFWDCKLYEDRRKKVMAINRLGKAKGITEVSYRALKALRRKKDLCKACYFINNIPKFV
jgi:hypothetical protein